MVLLDPNWNERGGGKIKRGADKHYKTAKKEDILHTIVASDVFFTLPTAHLWLWVPSGRIREAFWLIDELGFTFKRKFVWVKGKIGLGQYARGMHEDLLLATCGKARVPVPSQRPPDVFFADWKGREHSEKPDEQYEIINQVSHRVEGPRLEMYARGAREGWDRWGLEAPAGEGLRA